ncbi:hypothetical protein C4587_01840 [Candidatus Parcubacteria bacterium]|nr:MAG: hypothetical protein C4587_01840 [Candidatus Parcubacteria bacterium]
MQEQMAAARGMVQRQFVANYFAYSLQWAAVASAAAATAQLQIQADSAFMIISMSFTAIDNTTGIPITTIGATLQLTDQGSGANIFDRPQPFVSIAGSGQLPFILPIERVLVANSNLTGNLVAGTTTNANTYTLTLHGAKIYDYSPPNGKPGRLIQI